MHPSKTLQIDGFLLSAAVVINYYAFASSIVIGNLVWKHIFNAFSGAFPKDEQTPSLGFPLCRSC